MNIPRCNVFHQISDKSMNIVEAFYADRGSLVDIWVFARDFKISRTNYEL